MRELIALLMLSICTFAHADFAPSYSEGVIISTMELNVDAGVYQCSAPVTSYMTHVYTNGQNYYTQPITDGSVEGMPCIAHIVFGKDDREAVISADGYLGWGHDVVDTEEYQSVVTTTVKDMRSYYDPDGNYIEYTGEDADEPWPAWVFLTKEYVQ